MRRAPTAALVALLAVGCTDLGLEGNIPLEEAERKPPSELVAAVFGPTDAPAGELIADGRLWVPWGRPGAFDDADLRPVGSTHGLTVHARAWDRPPYDALFVPTDHAGWQGYAPVIGGARGDAPVH